MSDQESHESLKHRVKAAFMINYIKYMFLDSQEYVQKTCRVSFMLDMRFFFGWRRRVKIISENPRSVYQQASLYCRSAHFAFVLGLSWCLIRVFDTMLLKLLLFLDTRPLAHGRVHRLAHVGLGRGRARFALAAFKYGLESSQFIDLCQSNYRNLHLLSSLDSIGCLA